MNRNSILRPDTVRSRNTTAILDAAELEFAEHGFKGTTIASIAKRAKLPPANIHYYFGSKEILYQTCVERIFDIWKGAAEAFDEIDDPVVAFSLYITRKLDISRERPSGSKIWANEIIQGAPTMHAFLAKDLYEWTNSRTALFRKWQSEGRLKPVNPNTILYMIWATTQHYADFYHQIRVLNDGKELDEAQWEEIKSDVCSIILAGVGAKSDFSAKQVQVDQTAK